MLRTVVPVARGRGPSAFAATARPSCRAPALAIARARRGFADDKVPEKIVLPGSASVESPGTPRPPASPNAPSTSTVIPPEQAPKLPQQDPRKQQTAPPSSIPPNPATGSPPTPAAKPRKRRRFRRFLLITSFLVAAGYAGGIYYSLVSDDFHDFFTEYIPGGEDAVLFFEEREFKRRFPNGTSSKSLYPQVSGEEKRTFSGKSGVSARTTDTRDPSKKPATVEDKLGKTDRAVAQPVGSEDSKRSTQVKETKKSDSPSKKEPEEQVPRETSRESKKQGPEPVVAPAQAATPSAAPIGTIDHASIPNAADPVVRQVTDMLNGIITVINADESSGKYSGSIEKAKGDLQQLAQQIAAYKSSQQSAADDQIKRNDAEFDRLAKEMVARAQQEQKELELHWREEYEKERGRLSQSYQQKLDAELEAAQKVAEQKRRNELLEQNLKLQDSFAETIRQQVETERDARLSKLSELSTAVSELEKLTTEWNGVVDANLKTQHLVVAVDAVRSVLETSDRPTPFLHELAALKEAASNNGTVNAAIASIHPTTYQKGIPTGAQLIDRFRRVASEVRKASLLPEDAGVASHAASFVLSRVLFKKQGLIAGEDVESVLTRTETLLEEGDLDEAAREMNGLTGWARVLSQDWMTDCRRVLEVRQAMEVMSTEAKLQSLMVE